MLSISVSIILVTSVGRLCAGVVLVTLAYCMLQRNEPSWWLYIYKQNVQGSDRKHCTTLEYLAAWLCQKDNESLLAIKKKGGVEGEGVQLVFNLLITLMHTLSFFRSLLYVGH